MVRNKLAAIAGLALLVSVPLADVTQDYAQDKPPIESRTEESQLKDLYDVLGKQWKMVSKEKKEKYEKDYYAKRKILRERELSIMIYIYKSGKKFYFSLPDYIQKRIDKTKSLSIERADKFPWINPKNPSYEDKILGIYSQEIEALGKIGGIPQLR